MGYLTPPERFKRLPGLTHWGRGLPPLSEAVPAMEAWFRTPVGREHDLPTVTGEQSSHHLTNRVIVLRHQDGRDLRRALAPGRAPAGPGAGRVGGVGCQPAATRFSWPSAPRLDLCQGGAPPG